MESICRYKELMELFKDYCNTTYEIYRLHNSNEKEINKIYNDIKNNLIQTSLFSPDEVLQAILDASYYNHRYIKSYLNIFNKIYADYKEYIHEDNKLLRNFDLRVNLMDVYEENAIYRAIMNDDKKSFIIFTELEDFDKNQRLNSKLFQYEPVSLLELCCYHGAVDCFKLLRTKFNSEITEKCLDFSFLSGNPDIISECLKNQKPGEISMKHAIISHNIDFISFLMNEYNIKIKLELCYKYHNLQAFFVYLDQTNDINGCFIHSPCFGIKSLCEYFLSHGVNVNAKDKENRTILHYATIYGRKKILENLLTHRVDIDAKDNYQKTPIHYAVEMGYQDIVELLISNGANINAADQDKYAAIHIASSKTCRSMVDFLISHGALINVQDSSGFTPLHHATQCNRIEIAELLILNGADVNIKDKYGSTPLLYAANNKRNEISELLISHGADINETDQYKRTSLHYSVIYQNDYLKELLLSHGADTNIKDYSGRKYIDYLNYDSYNDLSFLGD